MATKPNKHIDWAVGNLDPANRVVEPSDAKKLAAWLDDERPPAPFFNWLFNTVDAWNKYFEEITDAENVTNAVIIGAGTAATHATLQAAVDDVSLGSNQTVFIQDSEAIGTTITLTKPGWRIYFLPGAIYSNNAAGKCFTINAANIWISGGRFTGWSTGTDIVFELVAGANYNRIFDCSFAVGTDTDVDSTGVDVDKQPSVNHLIEEV